MLLVFAMDRQEETHNTLYVSCHACDCVVQLYNDVCFLLVLAR